MCGRKDLLACFALIGCADPEAVPAESCGSAPAADAVVRAADDPRPELRALFHEQPFGSCLLRVSDHVAHAHAEVVHSGPRQQAFNADGSLVLLRSRQVMSSGDSSIFTEVPAAETAWVWHPQNPMWLYALRGTALLRFDLASGAEQLVREFAEYRSLVTSFGLPEPARPEAEMALVGMTATGGCQVLSVAAETGSTKAIVNCQEDSVGRGRVPRWAALTPNADAMVVDWGESGSDRYRGVELFDEGGGFKRQLASNVAAADVALDGDDTAWLVYTRYGEQSGIDAVSLDRASEAVQLLALQAHQNATISCRALGTSSCVVSTHGTDPSGPHPLDEEVFRLALSSRSAAPEVDRLAHHRSRPEFVSSTAANCTVAEQAVLPRASQSRDGRQVLFGSNWGQHCYGELYWVSR
jgi:hypothetical protein